MIADTVEIESKAVEEAGEDKAKYNGGASTLISRRVQRIDARLTLEVADGSYANSREDNRASD